MARFYNLTLRDPKTGQVVQRADGSAYIWTTNNSAGYDPGALQIEFDIIVSTYDQPVGGHGITLYGVALQDLLQANQFAGTGVGDGFILTLSGGMTAGLPLVNPAQAGILVQGVVCQSFGNWNGTNQTLDFTIVASAYTPANPGNIVLNWKAGQPLSQALANTLTTAYPGVKQNISISSSLVNKHDEIGPYPTLEALASSVMSMTQGTVSSTYPGVSVAYQGGQIYVFDGTITPAKNVQIAFTDLVGQPTWIGQNLMQMVTVLRGDLQIGDLITMPKGLQNAPGAVQTTAQSLPSAIKYKSTFQGQFQITQVRHLGNSRAADGQAWISVFNCVPYGAAQ